MRQLQKGESFALHYETWSKKIQLAGAARRPIRYCEERIAGAGMRVSYPIPLGREATND
jgi:hypothetical protein